MRRRGPVPPKRTPAGREGGFTLIELLVVICIIAVLTGLVTVAVVAAMRTSKVNATQSFLNQIEAALAGYQVRWGDYPPTSIDDLGGRAPNDVNQGVESLVACLSSSRKGTVLFQPNEEHFSNVDGDRESKNVTAWYFGDNELREYIDFFGYVIIYIHGKDFARPKSGTMKYRFFKGGEDVVVAAEQSPATKTYVNAGRYQLRSVGPDGKYGTPDDIRP
jgi:prepilin-type N-terminal cleavage/methylation domain-containing protein